MQTLVELVKRPARLGGPRVVCLLRVWVQAPQHVLVLLDQTVNLHLQRVWGKHESAVNQRRGGGTACSHKPFLIANRHLFTSDRQIALVSSAEIPLRQRSPHIDIVHLYKARGIENRHSAPC